MDAKGRLTGIYQDVLTGQTVLTFMVNSPPDEKLDGDLDITVRKHREKRSLNANAYFHVLAQEIGKRTGRGATHEKNRLIREYGCYLYIDDYIPTVCLRPEYEDAALDMEAVHLKTVERGELVKMAVMRGSHTYNTAEMAHLIDGAVSEAKELGIETWQEERIKHTLSLWVPRV